MGFTAQATTGALGQRLLSGFDTANMTPMLAGEPIDLWDREVSYDMTGKLSDAVSGSGKFAKYNLLAYILVSREKLNADTEVEFYYSGLVKEIRVRKNRYRVHGQKYLGLRKI